MKATELRFGIVGGGPGGLLTAIALSRKGFKNIHVFERDQGNHIIFVLIDSYLKQI